VQAVEVNVSPSLSAGALGSLGLGAAGGRARAPGIGAAVTKEVVNICLGMLAPQSGFEAGRMRMNMLAWCRRFCSTSHEGHELSLTPLGANFPGAHRHIGQHKHQTGEGGQQEGWCAKLQACIQLSSVTSEGRLRISSQIRGKLGTWHQIVVVNNLVSKDVKDADKGLGDGDPTSETGPEVGI
jgi:hypothetical protein